MVERGFAVLSGIVGDMAILAALGALALAALALAIVYAGRRLPGMPGWRPALSSVHPAEDETVFLFEDGAMLDASPRARSLLTQRDAHKSELERLVDLLDPLFPGLSDRLTTPQGNDRYHARAASVGDDTGAAILTDAEVEHFNGRIRLTLTSETPPLPDHPLAIAALREEMDVLQRVAGETRELVWSEDASGTITWANKAYMAFADRHSDTPDETLPSWPPAAIFPSRIAPGAPDDDTGNLHRRLRLTDEADRIIGWYDVRSAIAGAETLHYATDARALVAAEEQGRMFVQTLTETFAHLSIGLAIFDHDRRLVTFNPALLDLTRLPVTFLSARPTLGATLDRLREKGILQEPRNYRTWKQDVTALVDAARRGTYCETWSLTGGQTYRVTGRPHPNGAIAFLFEDISAELSLTRAFRMEIETAQAVLDTIDAAIAVFSPSGTLTTCNTRFEGAWLAGHDAGGLDHLTLAQTLPDWKSRVAPTPFWEQLRGFIAATGPRDIVTQTLQMTDGRAIDCRLTPLQGGATLVAFIDREIVQPSQAKDIPDRRVSAG